MVSGHMKKRLWLLGVEVAGTMAACWTDFGARSYTTQGQGRAGLGHGGRAGPMGEGQSRPLVQRPGCWWRVTGTRSQPARQTVAVRYSDFNMRNTISSLEP